MITLTVSPSCPHGQICRPWTEHSDDGYIRDWCLVCGRVTDWLQVLVDARPRQ